MSRKPRVDRSPEEKWQIIHEGIKSGNVSETCRRHGIAPNLFYRWKDEAEQGAKVAHGMRCDRFRNFGNAAGFPTHLRNRSRGYVLENARRALRPTSRFFESAPPIKH
jgi:transposase-like protein